MGAAPVLSMRRIDKARYARRLVALAANKRASRPQPRSGPVGRFVPTPYRLSNISDFPEPSDKWRAADRALKDFADELAAAGGPDLLVDVYDEAVEQFGYPAVAGVSASWNGLHHWHH